MNNSKKLVLDIIIFVIIIITMVFFLVFKNTIQDVPTQRMEAIGYSIGASDLDENITETSITTIETTSNTDITTTPPETETKTETTTQSTTITEPINPTIIDYSNIRRASLPSEHCNEVASLKEYNPDTRGWISISNTNISYAFTQAEDDYFYLDHDFDKNESHSGWVYMNCDGVFDDNGQQSSIITFYGHNMGNGTMFNTLKKYRDNPDFYQANPIITLSSVNNYKYYKIFAYMVCYGKEGSDFEFWKFKDLSNPDDFYYYVNSAFRKSKIITGVDVQYGDKIIALSTCNTGSSTNHDRFVVLARMVRDGEDIYEGCYRVR